MIFRFLHNQDGAVIVEAALALPVLILLGLGAADYSNLLMSHHKMQSGVTHAGNYLARSRAPVAVENTAKNLAVTGQTAGGTARLRNWTVADITISYKNQANYSGQYRGDTTIQTVQVSTSLAYKGLGIVNAVSRGPVIMTDTFEARIDGGGA